MHEAVTNASGGNDPGPGSFVIAMENFEQQWFMHPDPTVDLCVMPL
jgi:hypothetical protein